jgi:hypothetical protein
MARKILAIPAVLLIAGMYMCITLGMVRLTLSVGDISAAAVRALARCGELGAGVIVLLGGTFIATKFAVWLFQPAADSSRH